MAHLASGIVLDPRAERKGEGGHVEGGRERARGGTASREEARRLREYGAC